MRESFNVTILGSSAAVPTAHRSPSSQLITVNSTPYLIDCAEGTQQQLRRYKKPFGKINNIFISHLHSDHCLGVLGMLSTYNLIGRRAALNIYAHPELEKFIGQYLDFTNERLDYPLNFHYLSNDRKHQIFEDKRVEIFSFPLKHKSKPTCGFLVKEKSRLNNIKRDMIDFYKIPISQIANIKGGADFISPEGITVKNSRLTTPSVEPRSYAYCSDTAPSNSTIDAIKGVDVLYHETTFCSSEKQLARRTGHSMASDAAEIANKAEVGVLLTGHYSNRYSELDTLLHEAQQIFPNTKLVNDGDIFEITKYNIDNK